jgi:hypothetical protein
MKENELTGRVPTDFGRMASLTQLTLHASRLAGPIPTELCLWKLLHDIALEPPAPAGLPRLPALSLLSIFAAATPTYNIVELKK